MLRYATQFDLCLTTCFSIEGHIIQISMYLESWTSCSTVEAHPQCGKTTLVSSCPHAALITLEPLGLWHATILFLVVKFLSQGPFPLPRI